MKVAHVVRVTPRKCGLYETTRELVVALRALGVDSKMVPFCGSKKDDYCEPEDRGAPITAENYLNEADVIVNHSAVRSCSNRRARSRYIRSTVRLAATHGTRRL